MAIPFNVSAITIMALKRKCPKCFREQVVAPSKKFEKVSCKFCGASIPPK